VNDGYISIARLDDMATHIIAAWYFLHQDEGILQQTSTRSVRMMKRPTGM
jgi:hypothetical protein